MPAPTRTWHEDQATELMALIAREQSQLATLAAQARQHQDELSRLFGRLGPSAAGDDVLESLVGLQAVRAWLAETARSARHEALAFAPGGAQPGHVLAAGKPLDKAALARGVRLRTVYLASATHDPATRRHVQDLSLLGAQFRTTASLPMRLLVVDAEVALLPLRVGDSSAGAFVVRDRGTLLALGALFEAYWEQGMPFGERRVAPAGSLTAQEQLLVSRLAEGATDHEVAEALGLSIRTVRRMVATLLGRLDARSRFQAGVHAVRAGWLDQD